METSWMLRRALLHSEQNDVPTNLIRCEMGVKKRRLSWSGAASHAGIATKDQ
jgi:hypothetical protein